MSPRAKVDDGAFVQLVEQMGITGAARRVGINLRTARRRVRSIEAAHSIVVPLPGQISAAIGNVERHPARKEFTIKDGVAIVGSDLHIWPGPTPTMHRAFVKFCRDLRPKLVVLNGDVVDMAAVSRHPPIGWEKRPTVQQEIEAAQGRLHEIEKAAGRCPRVWTLGNHDGRFETRLAQVAPEYARINGVHLKDHFPHWDNAWSCWINGNVVIKHRYKGGIHAPWNNTISAGTSMVTGHLHSAKVTPFTDYLGTRYGVDGGCMADTDHGAFVDYTEDNPKNWRSAFCVLTFIGGKLMFPELVVKWDEKHVQFRGELIKV